MLVLTFEINFKSNYHIGAGYGKGFILDSALLREADGREVIRGTVLSGLLRDSGRRLLKLPVMAGHCENEVMKRLFGEAAQEKHWRIGSAYPVEKRARDSLVVHRVRIDPVNRRAEPRKLFSQEEGLAGQAFRFTVTCQEHSSRSILDEASFLVAAARNVRRIGRARRRGLGECVIHLTAVEGMDENVKSTEESWEIWFLNRFRDVWLLGKPASVEKRVIWSNITSVNNDPGDKPLRIRVIARLDEPLLAAQGSPAGNQFESNTFIPGSVLLGALAGKAARHCDLASPDTYRNFVALFRRGGISFPMLYPARYLSENIYPTIPAPLGLLTCSIKPYTGLHKYSHGIHQARLVNARDDKKCPECGSKLESAGYYLVLKQDMPVFKPRTSTEMHIMINDQTQRVDKGNKLFGYTLLASGQYFTGDLICANEEVWQLLQSMSGVAEKTPIVLYLGKGRQRGYGRITMWLERYSGDSLTWMQNSLKERVSDPSNELCLTFLTDTIVTDIWGRQAVGIEPGWLQTALGLGPLEIKYACATTRVVDSFNAVLGLPRWRDLALSAGATVWLQLKDPPVDWETRMQKLEAEGIGWRRNEGFGCLAFNHPVFEQCKGLRNTAISLDPHMRLGPSAPKKDRTDVLIEQWEKQLEESFTRKLRLDDTRLISLARWLYVNSSRNPEELTRELVYFGDPKKDEEFIKAVGGEEEYGCREVSNKEYEKEFIAGLLNELQKWPSVCWRPGIEKLAERLRKSRGKGVNDDV